MRRLYIGICVVVAGMLLVPGVAGSAAKKKKHKAKHKKHKKRKHHKTGQRKGGRTRG